MKRIATIIIFSISIQAFSQVNLSIIMDTTGVYQIFKSNNINSETIGILESYELIEIVSMNGELTEIKRSNGRIGFINNTNLIAYDNLSLKEKKEILKIIIRDYKKLSVKKGSYYPNKPPLEIEEMIATFITYKFNPFLPTIEDLFCNQSDYELLPDFLYHIVNNSISEYEHKKILEVFANFYFCRTDALKTMINNSGFIMDQIFIRYLKIAIEDSSNDFSKFPDIKKKKKDFHKWINNRKIVQPANKLSPKAFSTD